MFKSLQDAIESIYGQDVCVTGRRRIGGGDINDAYEFKLSNSERVFIKANTVDNLPFFIAEEIGLRSIRDTHAIGVPEVLAIGQDIEIGAFLILSYIEGGHRVEDYWERFGRELAAMHSVIQPCFGSGSDNFIGATPQKNDPRPTFLEFFRDMRLGVQFEMADRYFSQDDRKKITRLLDHMNDYYIEPEHPSLIHGDLWSGNYLTGNDGRVWIIDPAVYAGHPEADLAMTELFGRCPQAFYDAYNEVSPLQPGYSIRKDFYNLYHLLNHLNLFGAGYLPSVRQILYKV